MVLCCERWLVLLLLLSLLSAPVRPTSLTSSPLSPLASPDPSGASSSSSDTRSSSVSSSSSSSSSSLVVVVDSLSSLPSSSSSGKGGESPLSSAEGRGGSSSANGGTFEPRISLAASSLPSQTSSSASSSVESSAKPSPGLSSSSTPPAASSVSKSSRTSSTSSVRSSRRTSGGAQVEGLKRGRGGATEKPAASAQDKQVLKAVERSLLGALGLTSRPRRGGEVEVPPYMWDLYLQQTATPSSSSSSTAIRSPFLKGYGSGSVAANTVRSFYHTDHHVTEGCDPSTCARLLFDVTSVPHSETLAAAELRLYVDFRGNHSDRESLSQNGPRIKDGEEERFRSSRARQQDVVVEVHEVMQTGEEEDCITRLLDTRRVKPAHGSSWQSFDIHPAVLKWKRGPAFNKGLEIRLLPPRPSDAVRVRVRRWAEVSEEQWRLERPLLVTYTDDGRGAGSKPAPSRSKRATRTKRERKRRRKGRAGKTSKRKRRNRKKKKRKDRRRRKKGDKNMCRRHALYVDFQEVGWEDWIVAPDGYNAYFCQGDCNFPLAQHLNSTNHAIVQTLVNSVDPTAVSKACCVPTELSAISMLYLNERGKVQLKNYQDMVVEACGCR